MHCLAGLVVAVAVVGASASIAEAGGLTTRYGLTYGVADQGAPMFNELGPLIAVGARLGPLVLEVDYAYLSFMGVDVLDGGKNRLGVNLRVDVLQRLRRGDDCRRLMACTKGYSLYAEAGLAKRTGRWVLDNNTMTPEGARQREAHLGFGFELDNSVHPWRHGWQFGVRITAAPRKDLGDPMLLCRGASCGSGTPTAGSDGTDLSVLIEWAFVLGR